MSEAYAHTHPDYPDDPRHWEPLFSHDCPTLRDGHCDQCASLEPKHGHLNKVAHLAANFAADMFAPGGPDAQSAAQWGRIAGWWHDLGKFAPKWQEYLRSKADPHTDDVSGKVDHSTAGAQQAVHGQSVLGHILAYGIAAHHCGLLDAKSNHSCQRKRLEKATPMEMEDVPAELAKLKVPALPPFLEKIMKNSRDGFSMSFFTRLLYSCLVDADFLATEAFMNPSAARRRNPSQAGIIQEIETLVYQKIESFGTPSAADRVNYQRANVVADCRTAARDHPGLFTLTVPTGGGKTLSSLAFALQHARERGQRRIIYVVPFTSIIEQNADVIRDIVAPLEDERLTPLIEHHSALSPEKETETSRLASENWDAPIIITTAVQFYESLFAAKTSKSRKIHNIANAVVVLDEAQTLPVNYLSPCLRVLQELADHYNTTSVLCTATQPAIRYDARHFPIGLRGSREIVRDNDALFHALKRVEIENLGKLPDADLVGRIKGEAQVLCIVNRRKHAQELYKKLGSGEANFHLSALMCPEHRSRKLDEIRDRLSAGLSVRLISTQLVEAGVDVDFPVVYRALAGLDSIAQAAGRCNRNGKLQDLGRTYVFKPEDEKAEAYFRETAQVAAQVIDLHPDLLANSAIQHYFDLYYYEQMNRWDENCIVASENHRLNRTDPKFPFLFNFRTIANNFRLIDDWQEAVIVPYDEKARSLIKELRNEAIPLHRNLLRGLQRYTVQIPPNALRDNLGAFERLRDDQFHVLISPELNYSEDFGLALDEAHTGSRPLICD